MIAYLFWHVAAEPKGYAQRLVEFHASLASAPPAGFVGSATFRTQVPWIDASCAYEDWYLVDSWEALGVLNAAAIDARHGVSHDRVAALSSSGAGAVYELRYGAPALAGDAAWVDKPPGRSSADALAELAGWGESVWQRQLVLGPAPEFCVLGPSGRREGALTLEREALSSELP